MNTDADPIGPRKLWCTGPLLHAIQTSSVFEDAKTFVDMPSKVAPAEIEAAFTTQFGDGKAADPEALGRFIATYFHPAGSDLPPITISQHPKMKPEFLEKLTTPESRDLAQHIHNLWFELTREASADATSQPDNHTLLALPHPFIIPGDRFRECYYWDTFWSIKGMIITGLVELAKGIVDNLLHMVELYGHVPNGNRVYYINRSQPPMLSNMVKEVFDSTQDTGFLQRALKVLVSEHEYWNSKPKLISITDITGQTHKLNRYFADWQQPRPEAYRLDDGLSSKLPSSAHPQFYRDMSSTAESGWDFSTRWCSEVSVPGGNEVDLTTIRTSSMLPVDLNAWLYQMECNIASFAETLDDRSTHDKFAEIAEERRNSIQTLMWNEEDGQWHDLLMTQLDHDSLSCSTVEQIRRPYVCNWVPLYCGCTAGDLELGRKAVTGLKNSGLIAVGGLNTSLHHSGQQWDHPNGWPPLQHMIVDGCRNYAGDEGCSTARDIAARWMNNCYQGFKKTQHFWEKYDVTQIGAEGGGGEYHVQKGFGWANGVVITFLDEYGSDILNAAIGQQVDVKESSGCLIG